MKKLVLGVTAAQSVFLMEGQIRYFVNQGYIVYLLSPYSTSVERFCKNEGAIHLPIKMHREISLFRDFFSLIEIMYYLIRIKPDLINVGTPKMGLLGMIASKLMGIHARVYTCRGLRYEQERDMKRYLLMFMEKVAGYCAHKIICISPSVKHQAVVDHIFCEKKCVVINKGSSNGVNLDLFSRMNVPPKKVLCIKNIYNLNDSFIYGFVGRISDAKGVNELYEVFDQLYTKNRNIKLLFIGHIDNRQISSKNTLEKLYKHNGIILINSVNKIELPAFYSVMDVLVLPTWREGFGNVLIEAAAMEVPVISTFVTGSKDAVCDGYNGILIPLRHINSLYKAMSELYENESLRNQFGKNGKIWASNFSQDVIWEGISLVYNELISKSDIA